MTRVLLGINPQPASSPRCRKFWIPLFPKSRQSQVCKQTQTSTHETTRETSKDPLTRHVSTRRPTFQAESLASQDRRAGPQETCADEAFLLDPQRDVNGRLLPCRACGTGNPRHQCRVLPELPRCGAGLPEDRGCSRLLLHLHLRQPLAHQSGYHPGQCSPRGRGDLHDNSLGTLEAMVAAAVG